MTDHPPWEAADLDAMEVVACKAHTSEPYPGMVVFTGTDDGSFCRACLRARLAVVAPRIAARALRDVAVDCENEAHRWGKRTSTAPTELERSTANAEAQVFRRFGVFLCARADTLEAGR